MIVIFVESFIMTFSINWEETVGVKSVYTKVFLFTSTHLSFFSEWLIDVFHVVIPRIEPIFTTQLTVVLWFIID